MAKKAVLIMGAGHIGVVMACMLADTRKYKVYLADHKIDTFDLKALGDQKKHITLLKLAAQDPSSIAQIIQDNKITALISCLPYYCNVKMAKVAKDENCHYFDLTEDVEVTKYVGQLAKFADKAFVPQCGVAPGFISIVAHDIMQTFDEVDTVLLRVGGLPENPNNALKYALTWSTEGLLNEYANTCYGLFEGKIIPLMPLEGLETIEIDGLLYEAFNTSGGLGTLAHTHEKKVNNMTYKTLRYPGHCEKMRFLMNDLKLNEDREILKCILEKAIPRTLQDVVVMYVAIKGYREGALMEETFVKKIWPKAVAGQTRSALQISTAASACAVVDIVLSSPAKYKGFVKQESFPLKDVRESFFGHYYD